jgi:FAD/FMN-containing dehydrogenase
MVKISSWGRLSADEHKVVPLVDAAALAAQVQQSLPGIAHGMGRSYGDVGLNPRGTLWSTRALDHFISFDEATGILQCEAGTLLRDIQRLFVPRDWMLPVTPGTQMVTVGGAIANDIHGKNHHVMGSFGDHVHSLSLLRTDGSVIDCGPQEHSDWFAATVGGMGLTGIILQASIQLRRVAGPWLNTDTVPYANLDEFFQLADESEAGWEHTVSWIDCIGAKGRGVFMRANHAPRTDWPRARSEGKLTVPFTPPISLINSLSLKPFNQVYYYLQARKAGAGMSHYEPFFYPLDSIHEWNRIYGPKGFFQYQCVVPRRVGRDAIQAMLREIARSGDGSFLAVLKTFGDRQSLGMLSFPQPGVTLALDFPNKGASTARLFFKLDAIVRQAGGRLYPAKDARMPRDLFEAGYPRLAEFMQYRDPGVSSAMSRRLMGS